MAAVESFVDCKLCNTEQVIPIVAGKLRMYFFCVSCHQMVHVKKDEIRVSQPPPPAEPEPEPQPKPEPEPPPSVPEPPSDDSAPVAARSSAPAVAVLGGEHLHVDPPPRRLFNGALPSDELWNESPSSSGRFSPRQVAASPAATQSPRRDSWQDENRMRGSFGRWSPIASPSGTGLPDSSDDPSSIYARQSSSPRALPLLAPASPTFSSLNRNPSSNRQLTSLESRRRDPPDSPSRTPPAQTPEAVSPVNHRLGSLSSESVESWSSQALDGVTVPQIPRSDTYSSRSAASPRSPSRPLLWRGSFNSTDPLDRGVSIISLNDPPPVNPRRTLSAVPFPSGRRSSASSYTSISSEEDIAPSSPRLSASHLNDHSPTSPRSPISPRPANPHSPPGVASGYWAGQSPSSPRSPRGYGWKDTRVPKRTTLQTLERERKYLSSKDSFSPRPSSPLAPSSGLLPSSPTSVRTEWRSPPQSPLAPDDGSPPAFDLSGGATDTPSIIPMHDTSYPTMSGRRSFSSNRALPRTYSAQSQPHSPSGSSPRSPISPSIIDPAPLPLSPPDSPRRAALLAVGVAAAASNGTQNGHVDRLPGSPRQPPLSPMFSTYPRTGSKAWSRDEPSPRRGGSLDEDADIDPFQILRNGSLSLSGSGRLDHSDVERDRSGDKEADATASEVIDDKQEFSFQLAKVYEGPPLSAEIPVAKPLLFVKQGSGRLVREDGEDGEELTAILSFADFLSTNEEENGDEGVGKEGVATGPEPGRLGRSSILGAFFPRTKVVPSSGDESGGPGSRVGQTKGGKKGECSLCLRSSGVREKCLVCKKRYCQRCVAKVNAMGSMPEGRKCTSCIGQPIDESFRDELGKTRMLRTMGFTHLEVANIMKAELECRVNQVQPQQIIVNGQPLQEDELVQLVSCRNPPSQVKPGEYWYDPQAGFWGKLGGRPDQRISTNLHFRGQMMANCSGGTTGVFLNSRELGRMELNILRVAGVDNTRGTRLWVDGDGSFSEEGQSRIYGNLWEKSSVRLLSSSLSYPKLNQAAAPVDEDGNVSDYPSSKLPPHLRGLVQKPAHKILVLGCEGSGRSTIIKQVKLLYGKGFSRDDIEAYKVLIMRTMWRALTALLEAREHFCREDSFEEENGGAESLPARQESSLGSLPEDEPSVLALRSSQDWVASSGESKEAVGNKTMGSRRSEEPNGLGNGSDPGPEEPSFGGSPGRPTKPLSRHPSEVSSLRSTYSFRGDKDELADWILDYDADEDDLPVCDKANAAKLDELWRDPAVQATYERSAEVSQFSPFAALFLDKVLDLADPGYQPTVEDILHAEGLPQGQAVTEVEFGISPPERPPTTHSFILTPEPDFRVHLISVGYREARKLLSMFDTVQAVIFCISLSDYDVESGDENRMEQARDAFQQALRHPSFCKKPVILLLNKFDAFAAKIELGVPLHRCPWLADYQPMNTAEKGRNQPQQAYSYIVYKFKEAYLSCVPEDPGMQNFFTCQLEALKEQGVETVFAYVKEVLQWRSNDANGSKGFKLHHISYMADQDLALCESNFEFPLTSGDTHDDDQPGSPRLT